MEGRIQINVGIRADGSELLITMSIDAKLGLCGKDLSIVNEQTGRVYSGGR